MKNGERRISKRKVERNKKKKLIDKDLKFGELAEKIGYTPWGLRNAINNLQPKVLDSIEKILI